MVYTRVTRPITKDRRQTCLFTAKGSTALAQASKNWQTSTLEKDFHLSLSLSLSFVGGRLGGIGHI